MEGLGIKQFIKAMHVLASNPSIFDIHLEVHVVAYRYMHVHIGPTHSQTTPHRLFKL